MSGNQLAQTSIYYTQSQHNLITLWNGQSLVTYPFTQSSVALDATNWLSGNLYDLFMYGAPTPVLYYGPAWTNLTTRSLGLDQSVAGIWTNASGTTLRSASGTTVSAAANSATWVGTGYGTANGQCAHNVNTSGNGGSAAVLGLCNGYNLVPVHVRNIDTETASYTYASATWRAVDNSPTGNIISWIDPLGTFSTHAWGQVPVGANTGTSAAYLNGLGINWTSGAPVLVSGSASFSFDSFDGSQFTVGGNNPVLGYNTYTFIESASTATAVLVNDITGNGSTIYMEMRGWY
jgi:hypothetical protein